MTLGPIMILRLADPAYTERLSAFAKSLGLVVVETGKDFVKLGGDVSDAELGIYLRVWSVLHPAAAVSVG